MTPLPLRPRPTLPRRAHQDPWALAPGRAGAGADAERATPRGARHRLAGERHRHPPDRAGARAAAADRPAAGRERAARAARACAGRPGAGGPRGQRRRAHGHHRAAHGLHERGRRRGGVRRAAAHPARVRDRHLHAAAHRHGGARGGAQPHHGARRHGGGEHLPGGHAGHPVLHLPWAVWCAGPAAGGAAGGGVDARRHGAGRRAHDGGDQRARVVPDLRGHGRLHPRAVCVPRPAARRSQRARRRGPGAGGDRCARLDDVAHHHRRRC
jgi:hypothetical protein